MSSSVDELVRKWKEEDGLHEYREKNGHGSSSSKSSSRRNISLESIETIVSNLFGSCSANFQTFFSTSPRTETYTPQKTRISTQSNCTSSTTKSSSYSGGKYRGEAARSKSVDYRRRKKPCGFDDQRRVRSLSRGPNHFTSMLPNGYIENTEITFPEHDDDVSTITARTLNEIYKEEMQRKSDKTSDQIDNIVSSLISDENKEVTVLEDATHISTKSSGTTEFESIWRTKSNLSSNRNADNNHCEAQRENIKSGIYRQSLARLQGINCDQFSTIEEDDSLYMDEQEI